MAHSVGSQKSKSIALQLSDFGFEAVPQVYALLLISELFRCQSVRGVPAFRLYPFEEMRAAVRFLPGLTLMGVLFQILVCHKLFEKLD